MRIVLQRDAKLFPSNKLLLSDANGQIARLQMCNWFLWLRGFDFKIQNFCIFLQPTCLLVGSSPSPSVVLKCRIKASFTYKAPHFDSIQSMCTLLKSLYLRFRETFSFIPGLLAKKQLNHRQHTLENNLSKINGHICFWYFSNSPVIVILLKYAQVFSEHSPFTYFSFLHSKYVWLGKFTVECTFCLKLKRFKFKRAKRHLKSLKL